MFPNAVIPLLLIACWSPIPAHKFPDGYIDRTVSAVVRDRQVTIEYSVGMNDNTMRQIIAQWRTTPADAVNLDASNSRQMLAAKVSAPAATGEDSTNSADQSSDDDRSTSDEEEFENDERLLREFQELACSRLPSNLFVTCQGQSFELASAVTKLPTKRHMSVTLRFEVSLPDEKTVSLALVDRNLQQFDGGVRAALKATGGAILTKSNVAPIVIRAQRVELGELTNDERILACSINAQLVLLKKN